jgi:hypothetical protein
MSHLKNRLHKLSIWNRLIELGESMWVLISFCFILLLCIGMLMLLPHPLKFYFCIGLLVLMISGTILYSLAYRLRVPPTPEPASDTETPEPAPNTKAPETAA